MGLLDKIFGKEENEEIPDLEEVMDSDGDVVSPPADFYVKGLSLGMRVMLRLQYLNLSRKILLY